MLDRIRAKFSLPPTTHVEYRPDNMGPTDIWDLALVNQRRDETVRQFWARFLLTKNNILDCTDQEALVAFDLNVHDERARREFFRRRPRMFAELSDPVTNYCTIEDARLANQEHQAPGSKITRVSKRRQAPPPQPPIQAQRRR